MTSTTDNTIELGSTMADVGTGGNDSWASQGAGDKFQVPMGDDTVGTDSSESSSEISDSKGVDINCGIGSARTPWYGTMLLLLSDVMGTGVLSLPFAAVTLGWAVTMTSIPLFAIFAGYSGFLLNRVKMAYPKVQSFADAARELVGPRFGLFTQICMLLNWGALAIYFLIATADGIGAIYNQGFFSCSLNRSIIAAIILIIPTQCRDFHAISTYLSMPSFLAILAAVIIVIVCLIEQTKGSSVAFGATTTVGPAPGKSTLDFFGSLSSIVFAYQGQSIFMELMTEMKHKRQFPKACNLAYAIMCFVYSFVVITAYGVQGKDTPGFLPEILQTGAAKTTVGVLVVLHITVSYVIAVQPFHMWLHSIAFPKTYQCESRKASLHWLLLTVGYIMFGWVIANLIPFFADVQSLIGAMFGAPIVFGWPTLFYILVNKRKTTGGTWRETLSYIGWKHSFVCCLFLFVFTPLFTIVGTVASVKWIVQDAQNSGAPFQC